MNKEIEYVLFESGIEYLSTINKYITKDEIEEYLFPLIQKPLNLNLIYRQLCFSSQNRQMSTKVIGDSIGGIDKLNDILFGFDPFKVVEKYSKNDNELLLKTIREHFIERTKIRDTNRSLWPLYCKSIIHSAHFLTKFKSVEAFYKWADFFANDANAKPALPLMISMEIPGIGFPLACDFLKEIGYVQFGKPDVHIKEIFKALNIIDKNEKSIAKQDYEALKALDRIAEFNNVTPYAVDKVFWLIGSGKFYRTEKNIGKRRNDFIDKLKRDFEIN